MKRAIFNLCRIGSRILFLFILLNSVCFAKSYIKISDDITRVCSKEMALKGFFLCGTGGAMMSDLKQIYSYYVSFSLYDIGAARKVFVDCVVSYLNRMNSNKELRPYLHQYPCKLENVDLPISFLDKKTRGHRKGGYVALVGQGKNETIRYFGYSEENKLYLLHEETFEEALKIVNNNLS